MFEKYVEARKAVVVEEAQPNYPQTNSKAALDAANNKRLIEILDTIKNDANMATKFALSPQEFASVIDWAKSKFSVGGEEQEVKSTPPMMGEGVDAEVEAAKNLKPKSEETEEEYLARRDAAIKAAISAKEESEEHTAMQSHYNTHHHALDLVDGLLKSPKKYSKADVIKVLTLALDKLNGKA